jgi:uncharacterized oligopeptide transporter (OPT) family protein
MKYLRALILGALLSIFVAMYSAYAGLKIGGVYWAMVTTSIVCMAILKLLGNTSKNEINVAQTAANTGGLLAAGIIFTIPAAWMLGLEITALEIVLIALVGGLIGVLFAAPLRKEMVEKEKLPYPEGAAAANLIEAGDEGGSKAKLTFSMFAVGGIFALLREQFHLLDSYMKLKIADYSLADYTGTSLISFAGGYLIGPKFTFVWFLGAIASYFILVPNEFADVTSAAYMGIGIVLGASIAYFLLRGLPSLGRIFRSWREAGLSRNWGISLIILVGLLTIIVNLNVWLSVLAIIGSFAMAFVGARITGEMNVDPMELFAMIVMLIAKVFLGFEALPLVILAAIVCIAAGMGGDMLQDFKTGYLLKTEPLQQTYGQVLGVITASLVLGFVLVSLNTVYGIGATDPTPETMELPAPQATAMAGIIGAESISGSMLMGIAAGFVMTFVTTFLGWGIVPVAFGIGMYVPLSLSLPLFAGGIIRYLVDMKNATEKGRLVAAGIIGGEGFIGVVIALYMLFTSGALL